MSKPGDFMLGLLDFFAVLLPGMVVTWLAWLHLPSEMKDSILVQSGEQANTLRSVLFLFASYALGHFVFGAGSKLDTVYDRWRKLTKSNNAAFLAAQELREGLTPQLGLSDFSTLKWARTYVGMHSSAARIEIDRYEATSKFFRSMVIVSAALGAEFLLASPNTGLAAASVVACLLSFDRFCDQRFKMTELTYAAAVILRETTASPSSNSPASGPRGEGTFGSDA